MNHIESDELDGCELDFKEGEQTSDEEVDLMPLFAEALDPESPVTIQDVEDEWREVT